MPENNSLFDKAVVTPDEIATPVTAPVDDVIDIDLSATSKKHGLLKCILRVPAMWMIWSRRCSGLSNGSRPRDRNWLP